MRKIESPRIGDWYKDKEFHDLFEVVASDEKEGYVAVQYFSGEIEEFDFDSWYQLNLEQIPPPEDCSGPFEASQEDFGYDDVISHNEDWSDLIHSTGLDQYF